MLEELNKWALSDEFKLRFSEGKKVLLKSFKLTCVCSSNGCPYKLIFKSQTSTEGYRIEEKHSRKYRVHSKIFILNGINLM